MCNDECFNPSIEKDKQMFVYKELLNMFHNDKFEIITFTEEDACNIVDEFERIYDNQKEK